VINDLFDKYLAHSDLDDIQEFVEEYYENIDDLHRDLVLDLYYKNMVEMVDMVDTVDKVKNVLDRCNSWDIIMKYLNIIPDNTMIVRMHLANQVTT
jgi:uncharacterized protein Yka (UPF0111/DUF47 family)